MKQEENKRKRAEKQKQKREKKKAIKVTRIVKQLLTDNEDSLISIKYMKENDINFVEGKIYLSE